MAPFPPHLSKRPDSQILPQNILADLHRWLLHVIDPAITWPQLRFHCEVVGMVLALSRLVVNTIPAQGCPAVCAACMQVRAACRLPVGRRHVTCHVKNPTRSKRTCHNIMRCACTHGAIAFSERKKERKRMSLKHRQSYSLKVVLHLNTIL